MYESHFGLKERPFTISPNPRFVYLSPQHQECLAKAQYSVSQHTGLSVVYGDIGTGKTSLSRRLAQEFSDRPEYRLGMIVHPNYPSAFQLIREIRREFGLTQPRRSLTDELRDFQEYLIKQHEEKRTIVLLVDEAQKLTTPLFEVLRQLLNYETNSQKLLQIVLFGQNELATKIDRLPALKDRVTIFGALSSLTKMDMDKMIAFRWAVAGGDNHPFSPAALQAIFRFSHGRPRQVCKLCDNALLAAYSDQLTSIDAGIIHHAANDMRIGADEGEAVAVAA